MDLVVCTDFCRWVSGGSVLQVNTWKMYFMQRNFFLLECKGMSKKLSKPAKFFGLFLIFVSIVVFFATIFQFMGIDVVLGLVVSGIAFILGILILAKKLYVIGMMNF